MAVDEIGQIAEPEAGLEIQFCPVWNLPICRGGRVRTLPGFHLLSLGAGREALARGSYQAFGQKFVCHDLEYLHPDDRVFICEKDNKAFLNQMSMHYHRYICHELDERKAQRKRLQERRVEREARAERMQKAQKIAPSKSDGALDGPNDPYGDAEAVSAPVVDDDPYAGPAVDPYLVESTATAVATDASSTTAAARPKLGTPAPAATASTVAVAARPVAAPLGIQPAMAADDAKFAIVPVEPAVPAAAGVDDDEGDDLYGDIVGGPAKKQKVMHTYASAIGAILDDNFDEDD